MTININSSPYFDDYDASKGYQKILFVPGRPLQARELTQIQSMLQEQVKRGADFIFKNGSVVIPGNIYFRPNVTYIKLDNASGSNIADSVIPTLVGKTIFSKNPDGSTLVKAEVLTYSQSEGNDSPTLYIQYTGSGDVIVDGVATGNRSTFIQSETLYVEGDVATTVTTLNSVDFTGVGSTCGISEGIYYVNGYYVQVLEQTVVVSKYDSTPSRKVGLVVTEEIITESDDSTLTDNAYGFNNYAAPGAHRLKITLILDSLPLTEADLTYTEDENKKNVNFITLLLINGGEIVYRSDFTKLSEMEKVLADRTFDESGDYIVNSFQYKLLEYRNNNRGSWKALTPYVEGDIVFKRINNRNIYYVATTTGTSGSQEPTVVAGFAYDGSLNWTTTSSPAYNNGLYHTPGTSLDQEVLSAEKMLLQVNNGKAYIRGFQVNIPGKTYLSIRKARDFNRVENASIPTNSGSYFLITNVIGLPDINTLESIFLYDSATSPAVVGTCRVRSIDLHSGTIGTSSAVYKLFVFDITMNAGKSFSHDIATVTDDNGTSKFIAKLVTTDDVLSGSITAAASTTVNGVGTLFTTELAVGQKLRVGTSIVRVTTIVNDIQLTVSSAITTTASPLIRAITKSYGSNNLLLRLPHIFIRSLRAADDSTISNAYSVRRRFDAQTIDVNGKLRIIITNGNEAFSTDPTTYIVAKIGVGTCTILQPSSIDRVNSQTVDIYFTGENGSSLITAPTNVEVIATVNKVGIATRERKKIPKVKVIDVTDWASMKKGSFPLTEADAYRIASVTQSGSATTFSLSNPTLAYSSDGETDITSRFILDNGQTSTHYGMSYANTVNGFVPSKPIRIVFEYFDHTPGDYFSVNSYPTAYKDIPVLELEDGIETSFRDCLDFRARISDSGLDYTSSGSNVPEPLAFRIDILLNYSYYTQRADLIALDKNKKFYVLEGDHTEGNPTPPATPENTLDLFAVSMWPYTVRTDSQNVTVIPKAHKRYTMNAIGSLDKRITNLEYYASLSTLEKQTKDLQIKDQFGLDRFKNGFIVDEFKDHGVGDNTATDYLCAVDKQAKELRPAFYVSEVKLFEKSAGLRPTYHYTLRGNKVMLPYTEVATLIQEKASVPTKVNPWAEYDFNGNLTVYPDNDSWVNNSKNPKMNTITIDANSSAIAALADKVGMTGTAYGDWHEVSRNITSQDSFQTQSSTTSSTTATNYYYYYYGYYGYFGGYLTAGTTTTTSTATTTDTYQTTNYSVDEARTNITTTMSTTMKNDGSLTAVSSLESEPYMRMRHIVMIARGMKPNSDIQVTVNGKPANNYVLLPTKLQVATSPAKVGTLLTYKSDEIFHTDVANRAWKGMELPDGSYMDPNLMVHPTYVEYLTPTGQSLNNGNSYNMFEKGDVIKTATGKSAVLLASEFEFVNGASQEVLYITNELNWHFNAPFGITGANSGATATVTDLGQAPAKTNSAGTFIGVLQLPPDVECGTAVIRISLRDKPEQGAATTYRGQGIKTGTTTTAFLEKNVAFDSTSWTDTQVINESDTVKTASSTTTATSSETTCGWNYYYYYGYWGYYGYNGNACYYNYGYWYYGYGYWYGW